MKKIKIKRETKRQMRDYLIVGLTATICISFIVAINNYYKLTGTSLQIVKTTHATFNRSVTPIIKEEEVQEVKKNEVKKIEKTITSFYGKKLSKKQEGVRQKINEIVLKNGGTDNTSQLIQKIAFCESSFNPSVKNPLTGSTATGLYQYTIATWKDGLRWTGHTGEWVADDRKDIEKSTRMTMYFISQGELNKWETSKKCFNK